LNYEFLYFIVIPENSDINDLVATNQTSIFTSPNYSNPYPNNVSCHWTIRARPGYYIRLIFVDFETEEYNDIVTVRQTTKHR